MCVDGVAAMAYGRAMSSPGEQVVGGLFSDFEAVSRRSGGRAIDAPVHGRRWTTMSMPPSKSTRARTMGDVPSRSALASLSFTPSCCVRVQA